MTTVKCGATHHEAGQQESVKDANNRVVTFGYDLAGRVQTLQQPSVGAFTYTYDAASRVTKTTNPAGVNITTTYDAVGNTVSLLYQSGERFTYQYDSLNRRTTMVDPTGTTTYAYDAVSQLKGQTQPSSQRLTMSYDVVGNRTLLQDPDGNRFTSTYTTLDYVESVRDGDGNRTTFAYDTANRRTTLTDSSGIVRKYAYDAVNRLTTQVDMNSGGTNLVTMIDTYDAVSNRTNRNQDGVLTTWTYDNAYRLTGQQRAGEYATYTYDGVGNPTVKHHEDSSPMTFTYNSRNQPTTMLQGAVLTTFTHNSAACLSVENVGGVLTTYSYDTGNHLTKVDASGAVSTYTYDGDGLRRSLQESGGSLTTMIWDGADYLMEKTASATVRYTLADSEVIAEKRGGARYLYVPDPLGSTVKLIDSSQAITDSWSYYPYGEVASRTGTTATPLQFVGTAGYYRDSSGRIYVRARHLRTDLARWMTQDPIWFWGGDYNLYRYAENSPTDMTDPAGLWCIRLWGKWCIGTTCHTRSDCPPRGGTKKPYVPAPPPPNPIPPIGPIQIPTPIDPPSVGDPREVGAVEGMCYTFCVATLCPGKIAYVCDSMCKEICKRQTRVPSVADLCRHLPREDCECCCDRNLGSRSGKAQGFCYLGCK